MSSTSKISWSTDLAIFFDNQVCFVLDLGSMLINKSIDMKKSFIARKTKYIHLIFCNNIDNQG